MAPYSKVYNYKSYLQKIILGITLRYYKRISRTLKLSNF